MNRHPDPTRAAGEVLRLIAGGAKPRGRELWKRAGCSRASFFRWRKADVDLDTAYHFAVALNQMRLFRSSTAVVPGAPRRQQ
jgi:hypothetical protein